MHRLSSGRVRSFPSKGLKLGTNLSVALARICPYYFIMKLYVVLVCAVFILIQSSCSTTTTELTRTANKNNADIDELSARVDDLKNKLYVLSEQMESLRARFKDNNVQIVVNKPSLSPYDKMLM